MTHVEIEDGEILDRYLLRQLTPEQEEAFVDHYLECRECLEELEMSRHALAVVEAARRTPWLEAPPARRRAFLLPAWGLATALGLVTIYMGTGIWRGTPPAAPVAATPLIALESFRSGSGPEPRLDAATAAKPFRLSVDLRGLAAAADRVEIVSDSGQRIWSRSATAAPQAESLEVVVESEGLRPGQYWVRLWNQDRSDQGRSDQGRSDQGRMLREFSLAVTTP